jgi:protein-disulfide isomerase
MEHFKWLGPATVTRSKEGSAGISLEHEHIYKAADFQPSVVAEWIATGFAEAVEVNVNNTTTLKVKNVVVKSNAPKIGE